MHRSVCTYVPMRIHCVACLLLTRRWLEIKRSINVLRSEVGPLLAQFAEDPLYAALSDADTILTMWGIQPLMTELDHVLKCLQAEDVYIGDIALLLAQVC